MFIFDSHLDLAMNAMDWNRDLRRPLAELRERELALTDRPDRAHGTVSFPEMRRGQIGVCVATVIARTVTPGDTDSAWFSQEQAWAHIQSQFAWYREMERAGELVCIRTRGDLDRAVHLWQAAVDCSAVRPIGCVLSLEGGGPLVTLHHLETAHTQGLRAVGPAHYGPGIFAQGNGSAGGLTQRGRELLTEMERLSLILDVTHLNDQSFAEALDQFHGAVWASHSNCRSLAPGDRQLSDDQIRRLIERGAVIGSVCAVSMLGRDIRASSPDVFLSRLVDHMDHVCQLAGNAKHAGLGSDLDGGFGFEGTPTDVKSIADLMRLTELLRQRGFNEADVLGILHGNFLRLLRAVLPPDGQIG